MAVTNLDNMVWPLDTSVRVALFVPTTPDGTNALGAARTVYYCPREHGAISGIGFELYALLEDWVDALKLARYMHNSYTYVMNNDAAASPLLLASFPGVPSYELEPHMLYVGIDECPDLSFAHTFVPAANPDGGPGVARQTRVVRLRMQNHHIFAYLANRFYGKDEIEITVSKGVKQAAAFALLYMHTPSRVHAPAAAAAEAAAARRKKPSRAGAATKKDTATMFRGKNAQSVLTLDDTGAAGARKAETSDVVRMLDRAQNEMNAKRLRDKAKKRDGTSTVAAVKETGHALPHLRLVRSATVQAIFLQMLTHVKIDAFVHELERSIAAARAKAMEQAREIIVDFKILDGAPESDLTLAAKSQASATRRKRAEALAFTTASTLVVNVPRGVAEYVTGRLTPGPVPPPFRELPEETRRAYGTRPPLLEGDVDDPNCVHWIVPVEYITFARELGGGQGRGMKRKLERDLMAEGPPLVPQQVVNAAPVKTEVHVKEEPIPWSMLDF